MSFQLLHLMLLSITTIAIHDECNVLGHWPCLELKQEILAREQEICSQRKWDQNRFEMSLHLKHEFSALTSLRSTPGINHEVCS